MEPQIQPEQNESGQFKLHNLTRVTTVSKYLALALFIVMPFIGGWIGYQLAKSEESVAVVDAVPAVVEIETPVGKKPAAVAPGFMLEPTPEATDVNPEQKIYAAGMYVDASVGCVPNPANSRTAFTSRASALPELVAIIPSADSVIEVMQCWFAGGGQTYVLYDLPSSVNSVGVVRIQEGECGDDETCSPYGAVEQIWPQRSEDISL